jgi:hypothetical protein
MNHSLTITRPADAYEFTSKAALARHYADCKRRMAARAWVPPVRIAEIPEPPPVRVLKPYKSLRAVIMTLEDMEDTQIRTLHQIITAISKVTLVSVKEIISQSRNRRDTNLRQVFYYLARTHSYQSYPAIGHFCNRDHTSVMHGMKRIQAQYAEYCQLIDAVHMELGCMG